MVNFDKRTRGHADDERARHHRQSARDSNSAGPRRLPEHRYASAWWVLLAAFAVLVTGIASKQAPVVAVGVVLAAAGAKLYERQRQRTHRRGRAPRR